MKHIGAYAVALVIGLSACCAEEKKVAPVDLSGLQEIRIEFEGGGWVSVEEHFTITPADEPDMFLLRGGYETERGQQLEVETPISSRDVAEFVRQASSPGWARHRGLQVLAQDIDKRALRTFAPIMRVPPSPCTEDELQRLAKRHFGRMRLLGLIDQHYGHGISWTDDYPHLLVQMRWQGRPTFVMWSDSQKARMLPWNPGVPKHSPPEADQNWSSLLSASLRALLPPDSRAYQRLDGVAGLTQRLNQTALHDAERQCKAARPRPEAKSGSSR